VLAGTPGPPVNSWKILLEQSFIACIPLMMATSTFGFERSHLCVLTVSILTIKTIAELRNVSGCLCHESCCTVQTAAGCRAWHWWVSGDGYSACSSNMYNGRALDGPAVRHAGLAAKLQVCNDNHSNDNDNNNNNNAYCSVYCLDFTRIMSI